MKTATPHAMARGWRRIATWMTGCAALVASTGVFGDTVKLRHSIQVPADQDMIRLEDIATLEGPEAWRLRTLIIAERDDPTAMIEITVGDVHDRLTAAGVHWGRVHLSGRVVAVRPHRVKRGRPPVAMKPIMIDAVSAGDSVVSTAPQFRTGESLVEDATLRGAIAATLTDRFHLEPSRLRIAFRSQDAAVLDLDRRQYRFVMQSLPSERTETLVLQIEVQEAGRRVAEHTIEVQPGDQGIDVRGAAAGASGRGDHRAGHRHGDDVDESCGSGSVPAGVHGAASGGEGPPQEGDGGAHHDVPGTDGHRAWGHGAVAQRDGRPLGHGDDDGDGGRRRG